jgi:hypothetical protein
MPGFPKQARPRHHEGRARYLLACSSRKATIVGSKEGGGATALLSFVAGQTRLSSLPRPDFCQHELQDLSTPPQLFSPPLLTAGFTIFIFPSTQSLRQHQLCHFFPYLEILLSHILQNVYCLVSLQSSSACTLVLPSEILSPANTNFPLYRFKIEWEGPALDAAGKPTGPVKSMSFSRLCGLCHLLLPVPSMRRRQQSLLPLLFPELLVVSLHLLQKPAFPQFFTAANCPVLQSRRVSSTSSCSATSSPRPPRTSVLSALARKASATRALLSTASSPTSCSKVVTSPVATYVTLLRSTFASLWRGPKQLANS